MPHVSRMIVMPWLCFSQAVTSLSAAACGEHAAQTVVRARMIRFMMAPIGPEILLAPQVKCDHGVAHTPGAAPTYCDCHELFARCQPVAHRRRLAAFRQAAAPQFAPCLD